MPIRRAETSDAPTLALLGRSTFAETFGYLFKEHPGDLRAYLDTTFGVTKIEHSLAKPGNVYWLAFSHRLPVGYAKLKYPSPPPAQAGRDAAQLQKIYVLREFLGQRIGRDLLSEVLQGVASRSAMLWLDVLHENDRAIRFYERHGFTTIGEDTYAIGVQRFLFHLMARSTA